MNFVELLKKFELKKYNTPESAQVKCPAHEDKTASLTITDKQDKLLLHCHAGCSVHNILSKVGLNESDLFAQKKVSNATEKKQKQLKLIATYDYYDLQNNKVFFSKKYLDGEGKKEFKQGHYLDGKCVFSMKNIQLFLFNLPALNLAISKGEDIYIVEGEKDVESLAKIGLTATTNIGGAGKWKPEYCKYFQNCYSKIIILPDNDIPGQKHAKDVKFKLNQVGIQNVSIVNLPYLNEKGDVSDYLSLGKSKEDLLQDIKKCIAEDIIKAEKLKNSVLEIRNVNDRREEIEFAHDYIYEKGRIIFVRVLDMLHKYSNLKTSVINGKRKYFKYSNGYWGEIDKDSLGLFFFDYFDESDKTSRNVQAVINIINSDARFVVDESVWNSDGWSINLNNCAFSLLTYKSMDHKPEHYFTYKNNYDFVVGADCPNFDKALLDYSKTRGIPDYNWVDRFWEIAGYCMLGVMPYQKMFWFLGASGRNGKGTLIRIIEFLVGEFNSIAGVDTRDLRDKFKLASFIGKRLATAGDLHSRIANTALLKSLSGGDKQTTDIKFGDAKSFINVAKFLFAMNQVPLLPDNESVKPIAKRIIPLQFNYEITEPNSEIEKVFFSEISGIFNKAILGLIRLMRNNGDFTPVANADNWLKYWSEKIPPMQEFMQRYEYDENEKGVFLYEVWREYQKTMAEFYGTNWINEPNISVKGSRKLKEFVVDDIEKRYHVILETEYVYSTDEGGKQALLKNLKDTIKAF